MDVADIMGLGGGVGIFGTLFIGAIAGWIAEKLSGSDHDMLTNTVMGILGSFVGGWLANAAACLGPDSTVRSSRH